MPDSFKVVRGGFADTDRSEMNSGLSRRFGPSLRTLWGGRRKRLWRLVKGRDKSVGRVRDRASQGHRMREERGIQWLVSDDMTVQGFDSGRT